MSDADKSVDLPSYTRAERVEADTAAHRAAVVEPPREATDCLARCRVDSVEHACYLPKGHRSAHVAGPVGAGIVWDDDGSSLNERANGLKVEPIPRAVVEPPREGPDHDYKIVCCEDCGLAYGSDGWIECVLPNEDWAKISTSHDEGGILCITCIARRLKRLGLFGVPVMLCGTEAIRLADQDDAFERGWKVAEKAAQEQADEILRLRSALSAAQQDSERLDFLNGRVSWIAEHVGYNSGYADAREAIDAAITVSRPPSTDGQP